MFINDMNVYHYLFRTTMQIAVTLTAKYDHIQILGITQIYLYKKYMTKLKFFPAINQSINLLTLVNKRSHLGIAYKIFTIIYF